jgi:ParB/RepB/Spo0J family partition protein
MIIKKEIIEIPIGEIFITEGFNIREDFTNSEDLEESMRLAEGNISPIGVCFEKGKGFELLYGERRFKAAKAIDLKTLRCMIYEPKDDYEKFVIMLHENIGRKDLSWKEECKALKIWREYELKRGKTITEIINEEAKRRDSTTRTIWRFYEIIKALEEFPILEQETAGSQVLIKYKQLKSLDEEQQEKLKNNVVALDKVLDDQEKEKKVEKIRKDRGLIEELKAEVEHYKKKAEEKAEPKEVITETEKVVSDQVTPSQDVHEILATIPREERILDKNIWYLEDVKKFVACARNCGGFGLLDPTDKDDYTCPQCKKNDEKAFELCHWWHENFEVSNETDTEKKE